MCRPVTVGVYATLHVAIPRPLLAARVHDAEMGLNVPVLLVVKLIVPVGVVGLVDISMTFAVQVVAVFTGTEPGEQFTLVCVA
jgi:hypothetical protein